MGVGASRFGLGSARLHKSASLGKELLRVFYLNHSLLKSEQGWIKEDHLNPAAFNRRNRADTRLRWSRQRSRSSTSE